MKKALILGILLLCGGMAAQAEVIHIPTVNYNQRAAELRIPSSVAVETTDSEDFYSYTNWKYRVHTWVPVFLDQVTPTTMEDGCTFRNADGTVTLSAGGLPTWPGNTVENSYYNENDSSITYRARGENWYVVSGVKDGKVYYKKKFYGEKIFASLYFSYPYNEKDDYDWIVPVLDEHFTSEDRFGF
jgi:hypothetical protein